MEGLPGVAEWRSVRRRLLPPRIASRLCAVARRLQPRQVFPRSGSIYQALCDQHARLHSEEDVVGTGALGLIGPAGAQRLRPRVRGSQSRCATTSSSAFERHCSRKFGSWRAFCGAYISPTTLERGERETGEWNRTASSTSRPTHRPGGPSATSTTPSGICCARVSRSRAAGCMGRPSRSHRQRKRRAPIVAALVVHAAPAALPG